MGTEPDLKIPTMMYGTAWKEDRTERLTTMALAAGFRGIDTANQRKHYFEAGVGAALQAAWKAGGLTREDVFLQTKFTYEPGQDHRLPYDPRADVATQVRQSMQSSLEHLGTDHVDSYVLHGPSSGYAWSPTDQEAWRAMSELRAEGQTRRLGVSNVSLRHLEGLLASSETPPTFVQNRCFARLGWDRDVRRLCRERGIIYQGFSLLTANPEVMQDREVAAMAASRGVTAAQIVFRFAQQVGMLPLTGTSDPKHMEQDLACNRFDLTSAELERLESLAG